LEIEYQTMNIKLYYDYKSPYTFLALEEIYAIEEAYDVTIDWLPWNYNVIPIYGDVDQRTDLQLNRVKYMYFDVKRLARRRGLVIQSPLKINDSTNAALGALYAQSIQKFRQYNDIVFERFWKRELDIEDMHAITAIVEEVGGSADDFLAYSQGDGTLRLEAIHLQAKEDKVFGIPIFIVDGEPFWGNDRLWLVREKLASLISLPASDA
jgi:2-hydroxychromene-2-carboxylate isomerase